MLYLHLLSGINAMMLVPLYGEGLVPQVLGPQLEDSLQLPLEIAQGCAWEQPAGLTVSEEMQSQLP